MTYKEYQEALEEKERLEKIIHEYEENCTRGYIRVVKNKMGYKHQKDGYALQLDVRTTGSRLQDPSWKTIYNSEDVGEILTMLKKLSECATDAYNAFYEKYEAGRL